MDHGVDIVINGNKISYFAKKPRKSWSRERANYSLPKTLIGKSLRNYYVSKKNLSDKLFSVDDGFEFFVTVRFDFSHYEYMRTYDYEFNGENLIVLPTRAWKDGHKYKDSLMRAFKREFINSAAIWVVEIGEHHGPLHYHLYVKPKSSGGGPLKPSSAETGRRLTPKMVRWGQLDR